MTPSCYPRKQVRFMYISEMWIDITSFFVVACFNAELSAKVVATAFWRGEVENELRRVGMCDFKFKADIDYDRCMSVIDELRRESIYPHPPSDWTDDCKKRGK